jgi:hypothetical protein
MIFRVFTTRSYVGGFHASKEHDACFFTVEGLRQILTLKWYIHYLKQFSLGESFTLEWLQCQNCTYYYKTRLQTLFQKRENRHWLHDSFFVCDLFNIAITVSHYMLSMERLLWMNGKDLKGSCRSLMKYRTTSARVCRDWGKLRKTRVRICEVLAQIRTRRFSDTRLERHAYYSLPGKKILS